MSSTFSYGIPTGVKLNPGQVPAFTAQDMTAYLQSVPRCGLGPTLSGKPPTVESIEFATGGELRERLQTDIGLPDNALACFVVLRGPFELTMMSRPPGAHRMPAICEIVGEIFDASTGCLLVNGVNAFRPWRDE